MMRLHRALGLLAAVLAVAAWHSDAPGRVEYISAPDLAARIIDQDPALHVIDLRSREDFERFHVAGAIRQTLNDLGRLPLSPSARIVLYADDDDRAASGGRLLRGRGYQTVMILRQGIAAWIGRVLEPRLASDATALERAEFERASQFSRFFGGLPHTGVPRSEVGGDMREFARQAIVSIRRRGC
jgi:rhodanese-related sulfurtransferase